MLSFWRIKGCGDAGKDAGGSEHRELKQEARRLDHLFAFVKNRFENWYAYELRI